jgi:hypothetical protein
VFHRDLGRRYGPDRPQDKGIQPGRHQRLARPWERRRPRRHLLNGRRPHPSSPRHDHPNRPLGALPHRMWRARHSGPNDCIVWSRRIQLNPSRSKPGPEDSIQSAKPPLSLGALTPVASPYVSPNVFLGSESVVSQPLS